ncbi:T9SS type A sorting domain-containing protein [Owenweeksia hongkongensis]|uniref:T9SS type A sorting domain-containing protein n=1 Tax=Owenweeksia hongkongensis TaxID=253245 RepID=UPI003A928708
MKKLYLLFLILFQAYVKSQVLVDTTRIDNNSVYFIDGIDNDSIFYTSIFKQNSLGIRYSNNINIYNQALDLVDSIDGNQSGRTSLGVSLAGFFHFRKRNYIFARDVQYNISIHRISGNTLTDSVKLNFDTIVRTLPYFPQEITPNRLRLICYEYAPAGIPIVKSKIIDLDSNFNVIDYHAFDFSQNSLFPTAQSQLITDLYVVNNQTWHIHTSGALHVYNPQTHSIDTSRYLWGASRHFYPINANEYLAMGIVSFRQPIAGLPHLGMNALGFYRMNNNGVPLDTSYFLNVDNSSVNPTDVSDETMDPPAIIVYDTNNIYLASHTFYQISSNDPLVEGLFVVKTDSRGNEQWRYSWICIDKIAALSELLPTPDKGCILMGYYSYEFPNSSKAAAILIKLGPDGTISNVELDAPETMVSFYPNPIKDKLHYNFLPEAKGTYTLEIIDMQGRPVLEKRLDSEKGYLPVNLHTGFYLYNLIDEEGKVHQVGKLIAE